MQGQEPWLLKLVGQAQQWREERASSIQAFVASCSGPVPAPVQGFPRRAGGCIAFASVYVPTRVFRPGQADAFRLGEVLGATHSILAHYPEQGAVAGAQRTYDAALRRRRDGILRGKVPQGVPGYAVRILGCGPDPFRLENGGVSHVLHGDLVPANVLFPMRRAASPLLIDFEKAAHTIGPPVADLGQALLRFALALAADDAGAASVGRALIKGYTGKAAGRHLDTGMLRRWMEVAVTRPLTILAEATASGAAPPASEWRKFKNLWVLIESRQHAVQLMETSWAEQTTRRRIRNRV